MKFATMSMKTAVITVGLAVLLTTVLTLIAGDILAATRAQQASKARTAQSSKSRVTFNKKTRVYTRSGSGAQFATVAQRATPRPHPTPTPQNDGNGNSSGEGPGQGGGVATDTFEISGAVAGLYPGAARPLTLTLDNPAVFAVRVTELSVSAVNSDQPGCTMQNLVLPDSAVDVLVPGGSSVTHTLYVGLIADADNLCQGATWVLTYRGSAVQA